MIPSTTNFRLIPKGFREYGRNVDSRMFTLLRNPAQNFSLILLTESHSHENLNRVTEAKNHLYQLYNRLKSDELEAKVKKVVEAHTKRA